MPRDAASAQHKVVAHMAEDSGDWHRDGCAAAESTPRQETAKAHMYDARTTSRGRDGWMHIGSVTINR